MPPRSQAPLVARPPPPSQTVPPRPASPSTEDNISAAAAAKKKKKKGKGKKADDELADGNFHSPALSNAPFSATAKAQADLLATASDLYRRIEADPQGIPDDDAYWTSLPSHLRTFIRNALPIGHLPASAQNDVDDPNSRQASTQAMIAVAQQLAQAAHASQRQLQQHPPSSNATFQHGGNNVAYPPFPFDPSVFADLALQTEQALPLHSHPNSLPNGGGGYQYSNHANPPPTQPPGEPLPAPVVLVNEFDDEQGEFDDDYYSDEEIDHHEAATIDSRDGGWTNEMNGTQTNGLVTKTSAAKKKNKKKKKKGGTDATAIAPPPPPSAPLSAPLAPPPAVNQTRTAAQQPPLRSPASHIPPPSSRAAGKQPMTFNTTSGKAPVNSRSNVNGVGHTHNHGPISTAMGKRPASAAASSHGHGSVNGGAAAAGQSASRAWSSSSAEERERIKDFWLGLNERERKSLIKIEKDGVLKKMKEQQKHGCSCAVCGRKRSSIEDELEVLYDAYYDELEQYANHQQKHVESNGQVPPPPGPGPFPGSVALDSSGAVIGGNALTKPPAAPVGNKRPIHQHTHPPPPLGRTKAALPPEDEDAYDEDLEDDEYEDDYEYEDEEEEEDELDEPDLKPGQRRRADAGLVRNAGNNAKAGANSVFNFGSSLTVKGGILTVADDLLKNDGQKFLEMMEQLAERRALREEEVQAELENVSEEEEVEDDEEEEEEVELEEDALTDEQRMEEGRRMFQIFAARMFEQRVLQAYREKVAQERQLQLLRELEEEDMAEKEREAKKAKENQKKKDKKRQVKQQKEEERIKKEEEKAAEETAARVKLEKQREAELRKQEEIRLKREAEKRQKDEERAKKEEEKRKRQDEERAREAEKERKKREKEDKIRLEREARETKEREVKETKARQEEEERAAEQEKLAKAEEARKEQQQQQEREKQQQPSPAVSVPTSPSASKSQAPPSNPLLKSPSSSVAMAASSPSPAGRRGDSSANQQTPSSPLQGRSSGGSSAAQKSQPLRPSAATPPSVTSPSTLPAPPQGLPARPSTVSHTQQPSLPIGPAGASSLPRPPMQSIGTLSPGGPLGSPARQATPTINTTSPPAPGGLGKIVSPPLGSAPPATQAATPGAPFSKPLGSGMQPAQQHQPVQPIGRYPSMPFGVAHAGTPARSPPLNNNGSAYVLPNGGSSTSTSTSNNKGSAFDSMLGSPTSVNATTAGLAAMSMAGLTPSGGAGSSSISQMPIGPIGGGMPLSSSSSSNFVPTTMPHARTTSISSGMPPMDDYGRQGVSGPISRPAPGPIGPIGRRRDLSQDDYAPVGGSSIGGIGSGVGSGSTTSSIFGSSNAGPLPERVLGSSALGGDDELVEPQPRRTSHNTAPMANSSVFGGGAFGVSSPWGSSFAAGGSSNSSGGVPRTPSTPASSMLHSALGTGLSGASGSASSANPSAFGSVHQGNNGPPGVQASLNSGVDPWARAASGWDRARFAFEQPNTQQQSSAFSQQPPSQQQQQQHLHQQQLVSPGAASSHPLSPFGGAGQSQHPSLRGMFGAPGTTTSPHRHSNDRGL